MNPRLRSRKQISQTQDARSFSETARSQNGLDQRSKERNSNNPCHKATRNCLHSRSCVTKSVNQSLYDLRPTVTNQNAQSFAAKRRRPGTRTPGWRARTRNRTWPSPGGTSWTRTSHGYVLTSRSQNSQNPTPAMLIRAEQSCEETRASPKAFRL